ncbi:MAG: hypothetical protein Q8T13_08385 [Acidobacteriota bacterium]|nr:hypothetical protein [Acidobacteriota bacterium]
MSIFDMAATLGRAETRLKGAAVTGRRPRSDRGTSRIAPRTLAVLADAVGNYDRPRTADLLSAIDQRCRSESLKCPSRASIYKLLATLPTPTYKVADLPPAVRDALYNLTADSEVPGHQLAFYCFNYGDLAAVSFAAGLPWLALYQAGRLPGFRPRSRGLFEAVMRARGLA